MLKNYIKIASRNILRQKGYSFVNIVGLAVGFACCLLVFLYVHSELTYDSCYPDSDRIFRICTERKGSGEKLLFAGSSHMLTPVLRERFPEVEAAFVLFSDRPAVVRRGEVAFIESRIKKVQTDMFAVLGTSFMAGNPDMALDRPRTVVITEPIADKYFGSEDPLGQTLQVDTVLYEITGVIEAPPNNAHLKYDILCTSESGTEEAERPPWMVSWISSAIPTYVKLMPGTNSSTFEAKIRDIAQEYGAEELARRGETIRYFLQPIEDIHLGPQYRWETGPLGNRVYVFGLAAIGVLILVLASINFVNLSTARSAGRAAEVGVRKAAGARRGQLFCQFISESVLLVGISAGVAIVLVELALPLFSQLVGASFAPANLFQPTVLLLILVSVLVLGLMAGCYPALFLSRFEPVKVLKSGAVGGAGRSRVRKILVVGQFAICAVLMIGIVTVREQLDYMKDRPLGFEKDERLVIEMPRDAVTGANRESVKSEFLREAGIAGATFSSSVPGRWNYQWRTYIAGREQETTRRANWYEVDWDFVNEFGFEVIAGRSFERDRPSDVTGREMINEAAVAAFGWNSPEEALGQSLNREGTEIIGVIRDFHFRGLQSAIEPFVMYVGDEDYRYLTLRLSGGDWSETVTGIRTRFEELFPDAIFAYFFLDADFDRQYRSEEQLASVITGFTSLGIVVACLGLFALSAFMAEQRTKEIGIRKVLGASVSGIVQLLSREFLILVAIANVVAWPIAYFAMNRWLQDFAYRIELGIGTFVMAGLAAMLIALLTVSYQAIRAARANPVEALKYE